MCCNYPDSLRRDALLSCQNLRNGPKLPNRTSVICRYDIRKMLSGAAFETKSQYAWAEVEYADGIHVYLVHSSIE